MANPYRLEVRVNGAVLCLAGMPEPGVLRATLQVASGMGFRWSDTPSPSNRPTCALDITGMTEQDVLLRWKQVNLVSSDEIALSVLPPGTADAPEVDDREASLESFDPNSADQLRLDIRLNDINVCIAGMPAPGVLETTLEVCNWATGYQPDGTPIQPAHPTCSLRIGGLTQREEALKWMHVDLEPCDEVMMCVLPPGAADNPMYRYNVGVHELPCDWRPWGKRDGTTSGASDA